MKPEASSKSKFEVLAKLAAQIDPLDVIAVVGVAMVSAGAWMIYPPAALIVPGIVLFLVGVRARRKSA